MQIGVQTKRTNLINGLIGRLDHRWLVVGAITCAVVMLLGVSLRTLIKIPAEPSSGNPDTTFGDFESYWAGALTLRDGEPLYQRALEWRDADYAIADPHMTLPSAYQYPPLFALLFLPLTLLPFQPVAVTWLMLSLASLIATVFILLGLLVPMPAWRRLGLALVPAAAFAITFPARFDIELGQADFLLLLLLTMSLASFVRGHDRSAGVILGVAVAIKPFLGFLVLFYLWKRAYRAALLTFALAAGLSAVSFAIVGWDSFRDFLVIASYLSGPVFAVSPVNQSMHGLLLRLFTDNPFTVPIADLPYLVIRAMWLAVAAGTLMLMARFVRSDRTGAPGRQALEYGLVLTAMLFLSPLNEHIHFTYLAIPLVAALIGLAVGRSWTPRTLTIGVLLFGLYACLVPPGFQGVLLMFDQYKEAPVALPESLLSGTLVYWLVGLGVCILLALRAAERSTAVSQPEEIAQPVAGTL